MSEIDAAGVALPDCAIWEPPLIGRQCSILPRYLQTRDWVTVRVLQLKRPWQRQLETLMHTYITYLLERELKSVDFLHRLRQEAALFVDDD